MEPECVAETKSSDTSAMSVALLDSKTLVGIAVGMLLGTEVGLEVGVEVVGLEVGSNVVGDVEGYKVGC